MQLKATGKEILLQIYELTDQLNDSEYSAELELLNGNSIGKHVRHIVEFFDLLVKGSSEGLINYDRRKHTPLFEKDTRITLEKIKQLMNEIEHLSYNRDVLLELSYAKTNEDTVKIKSSVERELAYNIEHAIHHMAIIKIAVQTVFSKIPLAEHFGVAYSTVRYQKSTSK
jgi:uncharacterized damage-inducible protein DinB